MGNVTLPTPVFLAGGALCLLAGYLVGIFTSWFFVGLFVLMAVGALNIVFSIIAAVAANKGENYEYPLAIRFIR